jgi:nitrate reductase beta subunit
MWWNNVETKPGTGFPSKWEDQESYKGGWEVKGGNLQLRSTSKARFLPNIFHNPNMPTMDDYYEPWTYKYEDLFNSPEGDDQPTARPISMVTGEHMEIKAGPNWDDDMSGSTVYAANDPNLSALPAAQRAHLKEIENLAFFYMPRVCNHCTNPACVASCPSGAMYKRGEDGIVLIDQNTCRGWRSCVPACPYKKTYYNWQSGKSEKCILCFPRMETGQPSACFPACVGRIRYFGVLLYDAEQIEKVASSPQGQLIEAQRNMILDPNDPNVIKEARRNGVHDSVIEYAQRSPVYRFVKEWKMALPLHIEFRTLPMLFYVPPMSPVMATKQNDTLCSNSTEDDLFQDIEQARVPIAYLANLFGAGDGDLIRYTLKKQKSVRMYRRHLTVGDIDASSVDQALKEADCSREEAEAIYKLTSLSTFDERFVTPPANREEAISTVRDPLEQKHEVGFGILQRGKRGA